MEENFMVTKKEVEYFLQCANLKKRDNVLFFRETSTEKEVFLLLHGSPEGKVLFQGEMNTLEEVYHRLQKENVFKFLLLSGIKYIQVLCCFGGYQTPYKENGIEIKPYFTNKGILSGIPILDKYFKFVPTDKVA